MFVARNHSLPELDLRLEKKEEEVNAILSCNNGKVRPRTIRKHLYHPSFVLGRHNNTASRDNDWEQMCAAPLYL